MFVTTAACGLRKRKERSLSSASATTRSDLPNATLLPMSFSSPPTRAVGFSPRASRTCAVMLVVVVLPWVPVTATLRLPSRTQARASARGMTGMDLRLACRSSGFVFGMAVEITTRNHPPAFFPRRASRSERAHAPRKLFPPCIVGQQVFDAVAQCTCIDLGVEHQLRGPSVGKVPGVLELVVIRRVGE